MLIVSLIVATCCALVCDGRSSSLVEPWTLLESVNLPAKLQMSGVTQLGPFVAVIGGCVDIDCLTFSDDIILVDPTKQKVWRPILKRWNETYPTAAPTRSPPAAASGSSSESISDTEAPAGQTIAKLEYPIAGLHSAVSMDHSILVLGMCTILPLSNITDLASRVNSSDYFRRIQRITLLSTGDDDHPPSVAVDSDFALLSTDETSGRVNASCMAYGTSTIFVVGGVAKDTSGWAVTNVVDELYISLETANPRIQVIPGIITLKNAVTNPSVVSDAETLYIIGGIKDNGMDSLDVYLYFVPKQSFLTLTEYAPVNRLGSSPVTHSTVMGGNIVVGGDDYETFEAYSQRNPNGWQLIADSLLPVRNGTTWALPVNGNMQLLLFGGHSSTSKKLSDNIWKSELAFQDPLMTGLVFAQQGNLTNSVPWNSSVRVLLGPSLSSSNFSHCNSSDCSLRLSTSRRCDSSLVDLPIRLSNLSSLVYQDKQYWTTVEMHLPPQPDFLQNVPWFLYACYSSGLVHQPPSCVVPDCVFSTRFYTALNGQDVVQLVVPSTPAPGPLIPPVWTTERIVIVSVVGGIVLIILLAVGKAYCCNTPDGTYGSKASKSGPPAGVLGEGRYRVVEKLGRGSFSVVYLVERARDKRKFALKYIQCPDETERKEAMKECEVIAKLRNHPNVIHLEDMFLSYKFDPLPPSSPRTRYQGRTSLSYPESPLLNDGGTVQRASSDNGGGERYLSLVMEYHERGDLSKWVRKMRASKERIPEATIVSVGHQVCSVLHYMHTQNPPILHRDLKPENLLLSSVAYNNVAATFLPVVVSDFGLSRVMDKAFCETGVGSLPYVAPECWKRHYTTKIDIWATGCILFAMCARRVEAENVVVMFSESSRPDFASFLHNAITKTYGYSEELAHFIGMLLEVEVSRRPTAEQCLDCIKRRVVCSDLSLGRLVGGQTRSSLSAFGSGDSESGGGRHSSSSHGRTSSTSEAILEHYLVDVEKQEEIRKTGMVAPSSAENSVTLPAKRSRSNRKRMSRTGTPSPVRGEAVGKQQSFRSVELNTQGSENTFSIGSPSNRSDGGRDVRSSTTPSPTTEPPPDASSSS